MHNEPYLLIMAAGIGSRYGGLKQIDPVGPHGEMILDFSIMDAKKAGFRKIIFLIKKEIEEDFRELVGNRIEKEMDVAYAFQELDTLPEGYEIPVGRKKPYGTGHAVLCCKDLIDAPFLVINSDDYYGPEAFEIAYEKLCAMEDPNADQYMMVSYILKNTLTDHGYVARGICAVNDHGTLESVTERTHIINSCDGPLYTEDGKNYVRLEGSMQVSMNTWGFTPHIFIELQNQFEQFLKDELPRDPMKAEFFLPMVVGKLIEEKKASVAVYQSHEIWYGVTYKEDKIAVQKAILNLIASGMYQ